MAQDYNHRIGGRYLHIGPGTAPTVSDIDNLTERRRQEDKAQQKKPERPFSAYLEEREGDGGQQGQQPGDEETAQEGVPPPSATDPAPKTARSPKPAQVPVPRGRHIIKG